MPTFARRPSTMGSLFPVDIQQNSIVEFHVWTTKAATIGTANRQVPCTFLIRDYLFDFPSDPMSWIKEVEMIDSLGKMKNPRDQLLERIHFEMELLGQTLSYSQMIDTALDNADFFSTPFHDNNTKEFDTGWDEVPQSVSKIPSDDILGSLYKLRTPKSAQLKTVLELYDMEIHQKKAMHNSQKLKTMVKRSTDQKLRSRNFDAMPTV